MRRKLLIISVQLLSVCGLIYLLKHQKNEDDFKPIDWFYQQRAYPSGKLNRDAFKESIQQSLILKSNKYRSLGNWEFSGPLNIGGRLTDVEINHGNENEIWIAAASGGVFKSVDAGESFIPVFDDEQSLSIGDIAIAPSNSNLVYVGTGEANPGGGSLAYDGNGIYKSIDGGSNWIHLGLDEVGSVGRVMIHPNDENTVYVAAMGYLFENNSDRGVFKTTDGGNTWQNILYVNDSTGAIDLAIHPQNPDTIYAVMWERVRRLEYFKYGGYGSGIYRSFNGGESWEELIDGLPNGGLVGRIGIGISESEPNILYTIYADRTGYFDGLFKSVDGGDNWIQTNDEALEDVYASYGWWFGRLKIDPNNSDHVYIIGLDLFKTSDGGNSYQDITGNVHVDQHEIAVSPSNSNLIYLANDGGLYISEDAGDSWSHNKTLPITQFYTAEIDASAPYRLYGGTQDNGTNRTLSGNPEAWARIYIGDGFYCIVDYTDPRYVYAEYQYGNLARSTNYGSTFTSATTGINANDRKNWNTPVVMNPINPNSLYYGSHRVYKSTNKAVNWSAISDDLTNGPGGGNQKYGTITTLSVSPADTNIIYAGTDDANIWISLDNGDSWTKISEDLPQRWISRVVADPEFSNVAYVTLSGFRENEYIPHVFKTEDNGLSWSDISIGLPEAPVNDLIVWPDVLKRLIVATDVGVFYKNDNHDGWYLLADGLPLVPITDLAMDWESGTIAAASFGRSMYSLSLSVNLEEPPIQEKQIKIYPNPAIDQIRILGPGNDKGFHLMLFNSEGKFVTEYFDISSDKTIDVSRMKPGIYMYQLSSEKELFTGKLMIK
jgi:photosystem II stability/assembly factor-like uncharacterized protein